MPHSCEPDWETAAAAVVMRELAEEAGVMESDVAEARATLGAAEAAAAAERAVAD